MGDSSMTGNQHGAPSPGEPGSAGGRASPLRDPHIFGDIVRRSHSAIYLTSMAIVRDADTAHDITQETFLRAWLKVDTLRDAALIQPWLCRIARNLAAQWLRTGQQRSRMLPLISMEELTLEPADQARPDPRQAAGRAEENRQLTDAVWALPDDLRQAVLLHYADGMSPSDIARLNGEAPSTVTRRLDKARELLRQHLESGLAASLAASVQGLRPGSASLQRTLGIITAAAAAPAITRAQLLQLAANTPPPPLVDPVTSAATAAQLKGTGIMKSIIAKAGAGKLLAAGAAIAVLFAGGAAVNALLPKASDEAADTTHRPLNQVEASPATSINNLAFPRSQAQPKPASDKGTATISTRKVRQKSALDERIALLKNDLVSTHPEFVNDDGKTSGGTYLNMQVVDGSGLPLENATLNITQLSYKEDRMSGSIGLPDDMSSTAVVHMYGFTLTPQVTNSSGVARIFVPQYVNSAFRTKAFAVKARHPDYAATFADMELTSVTKIVMTGGHMLEVLPVDPITSSPIMADVNPVFDSTFKPDWERRPDGTISIRKISGDSLSFYLEHARNDMEQQLSAYQHLPIPYDGPEPLRIPIHKGFTVKGSLSPNVPRPVNNGKIVAGSSVAYQSTKYAWQEVGVNADGTFTLANMPTSDVLIAGLTDGYNSTMPSGEQNFSPHAIPHRFRLRADNQEYVLPMEPSANVHVKLIDSQGNPVSGVTVKCDSMLCFQNNCENWGGDYSRATSADGIAKIDNVPACQDTQIHVTGGWRIDGPVDTFTGSKQSSIMIKLSAGETIEKTLTVVPAD